MKSIIETSFGEQKKKIRTETRLQISHLKLKVSHTSRQMKIKIIWYVTYAKQPVQLAIGNCSQLTIQLLFSAEH